jgi:multisubunit Na+/H+ antiporter MnhC subunit
MVLIFLGPAAAGRRVGLYYVRQKSSSCKKVLGVGLVGTAFVLALVMVKAG